MVRRRVISIILVSMLLVYMVAGALASGVAAAEPLYHVVKWNDTLSGIARMYGVTVKAIMDANKLTNANVISVNQRLVIPVPTTDYVVHVVAQGESLLTIAAKYGVKYWEIAWRNGITNPNLISIGQRLIIPGAQPSPAATPAPNATPVKSQEAIVITSPAANGNVKSPLVISGFGSGFENVLAVDVLDQAGKTIGQGQVTVSAESGQYGPFTGTITFAMPATLQPGRVQVYSISPRDGAIDHLASVTVNLKP
jgi:LysM repeat protein